MQEETSPCDVSLRSTSPVEVTALYEKKGVQNAAQSAALCTPQTLVRPVMSNDRRE
jgi:hypothetical protein